MKPSRRSLSTRRYGNLVEALFEIEMLERGIVIGRPRGEPDDFDFFAAIGHAKPVRVQVRGTRGMRKVGPSVRVASRHRPKHTRTFDFLVVWIDAPYRKWVVIPRRKLPTQSIQFPLFENFNRSKWAPFVDRWDLFAHV